MKTNSAKRSPVKTAKQPAKVQVSQMSKSERAEFEASKYPLTDCPDWVANRYDEITLYLVVINRNNVVAAELCRHLATLAYWHWKAENKTATLLTKNLSLLPESTPDYTVYDGDIEDHRYRNPYAAAAVAELRGQGSVWRMTKCDLPRPE